MNKRYLIILLLLLVFHNSWTQSKLTSNEYLIAKMDSIVVSNMKAYDIPGVAYAIVKNKEVVHVGSQGLANLESETQVNKETKFMLGSIAKLFTALAVLQLYEQDKVDLDNDINIYLKEFQIPYKVTLRQLLTHTAGLEESVLERVKISKDNFIPLAEYLKTHLPEQILEPGKYAAYSNHGMALAGLVVQEVSGILFEDYIKTFILEPLNMNESSFRLNVVSKQNLATPYLFKNGKLSATNLEYVQTTPSAMLISSAEDFAKFMLFNLNPEKYDLVKSETLGLMHTNQYQTHPKVWGRAFGFFERMYRGKRLLEHGGSRKGFYCKVTLIPEDSLSIFIAFNGGQSRFREKVIFSFLSSIYEKKIIDKEFDARADDLSDFEGTYLSNRRSETDFSKLILQGTFVEKIKIEKQGEYSIKMLGSEYKMQSKGQFDIFNDSTASFPISFGRNIAGEVETLFLPGRSDSYKKMRWYQHEYLGIVVFTGVLMIFLINSIIGFIAIKRGKFQFQLRNSFRTYKLIYSSTNLVFLSTFLHVLILKGESFQYEIPSILYAIFSLTPFGLLVLVLAIYQYIINWKKFEKRQKLSNGLFLMISMIFTWQLYYWNFIGFNF